MALQLFKIASTTVESPQANIEFTSIPQGYTDLMVYYSLRGSGTNSNEIRITYNGVTTGYTNKQIYGSGSSVGSISAGTAYFYGGEAPAVNDTTNTFGNASIYIPNYTSSNAKSVSVDAVEENNASTLNTLYLSAGLCTNTAAITSIKIQPDGSFVWVTNSTATLYGVL